VPGFLLKKFLHQFAVGVLKYGLSKRIWKIINCFFPKRKVREAKIFNESHTPKPPFSTLYVEKTPRERDTTNGLGKV